MADDSKIEWTDATWNVITGCSMASPGCANCYAMKLAGTRLRCHPSRRGLTKMVNGRPVWTGKVRFNEDWLTQPIRWKKPRKIFVCAHSDLFHESVPDEWIDKVFAVMALCPHHTFQVLTKRPERMLQYINGFHLERTGGLDAAARSFGYSLVFNGITLIPYWPLRNVWLGVTAENQEMADERIPLLLQCPAEKRFVSIEPMLGPVDLRYLHYHHAAVEINAIEGTHGILRPHRGINERLDWVICGGESGHNARPMHPQWARDVRDQCEAAGVPFMLKQWGEWLPAKRDEYGNVEFCDQNTVPHDGFLTLKSKDIGGGFDAFKFGKKAAGRLLDGREHMEFPE